MSKLFTVQRLVFVQTQLVEYMKASFVFHLAYNS